MVVKTKRTKFRLFLCCCLIGGLLAFIWGNSLLPGEDSGRLSGAVWEFLCRIFSFLATERGEYFVRKLAHFSEFAALGFCLCWLAGMLAKPWFFPLFTGCAVAITDECIQYFTPGRVCALTDMLIDSTGVLAGVLVLVMLCAIE